MSELAPHTPFKPISKHYAAELLGVSTKTIDNYIQSGLLPAPVPFGGRDLWLPEEFYSHLRKALTPAERQGTPPSERIDLAEAVSTPRRAGGKSEPKDSCAVTRERQRRKALLSKL